MIAVKLGSCCTLVGPLIVCGGAMLAIEWDGVDDTGATGCVGCMGTCWGRMLVRWGVFISTAHAVDKRLLRRIYIK